MRYRWALVFVGLVALGVVGSAFLGGQAPVADGPPPDDRMVQPAGTGAVIWPYTSRTHSVEGRTLALNVVVHGGPTEVQRALTNRSSVEWSNESANASTAVAPGASPWRATHGAARYTYVAPDRDAPGRWVESEYQLHAGTYFGHRTHVRAYPAPSSDWTALQAHTEYWDWFRLRHTVTGVVPGAEYVREDMADEPFVRSVDRFEHGKRGGGSPGWMTVVRFTSGVMLVGAVLSFDHRDVTVDDLRLPLVVVAIVLGVRAGGIAAETLFPATNPHYFSAVLYPVLALGPLVAAWYLAPDRPSVRTAVFAAAAMANALLFDMTFIGVEVLPPRLALHRTALVGALGLFTLGASRRNRWLAGGAFALWVALLAATLAGVV